MKVHVRVRERRNDGTTESRRTLHGRREEGEEATHETTKYSKGKIMFLHTSGRRR